MPRKTLEAYGDIVETLYLAHKEGPFKRSELMNLFLQEMDIFREGTKVAHLKTMVNLKYLVLTTPGSAYTESSYKLDENGLEVAKRLIREKID
jgi:hypothetical protein